MFCVYNQCSSGIGHPSELIAVGWIGRDTVQCSSNCIDMSRRVYWAGLSGWEVSNVIFIVLF